MIIIIKKEQLKKKLTMTALIVVTLLVILTMSLGSKEVFLSKKRKLPIYSVDTKEKKIAITFDASWPQDNTDEIIEILDKYDVKATFFLVGTWIDHNPEKLKTLHEKGHEIGNHTNSHPDMNSISRAELIKEIEEVDSKIKKITGKGTTLFRCPSGVYNDLVIETVERSNRYCIQWDVDSIDWKAEGEEIEYNRVVKKTKPGSIILFHNDGRYTTKTLPRIIEYFKKEGYSMVTVSDLIYKSDFMIDYTGKQIYNK